MHGILTLNRLNTTLNHPWLTYIRPLLVKLKRVCYCIVL